MAKLGWISNPATAQTYNQLYTTAGAQIAQKDFYDAEITLNDILTQLQTDSGSALTPQAYKSLSADTKQLLRSLPNISQCSVQLLSSTGSLLTGGTLQYRDSTWKDASNNNDGTFTFTTSQKKTSLRMTYANSTQTISNITVKNDTVITFQTKNVSVNLQTSAGTPFDTGTVQYYAGSWQTFGITSNGVVTKELLPLKYSFRVTYNGATVSKSQNIDSNVTVIFNTKPVTVQFQTSTGAFLDTGIVQYYAGAWKAFGTTINGTVSKELLPAKYSFRLTYQSSATSKAQNIDSLPNVMFQTTPVKVQLQTSTGVALDTGTAQYYSGFWRSIGTTSNGMVSTELLPTRYSFRMIYNGATVNKSQALDSNATVVFQTVPVQVQLQTSTGMPLDTGIVEYYAGAWRDFGITSRGVVTKELLSAKYSFRITYLGSTLSKSQNIDSSLVVRFQTIPVTVQLLSSTGLPEDTGIVQFDSDGWQNLGTTSGGSISKELLPIKYFFRMTSNGITVSKSQNTDSSSTVSFSTVLCTINVFNSSGNPLNNAAVSYYASGWKVIGTTANGTVTKEFLPAKIQFRAAYGSKTQSVTQDISVNPTVTITLPVQ
ncbi:MAG TPA: hypothetical protein VMU30_08405 [Bacteroidota bacterium]|nr:hypothetical protein [Bacteroidota bacterium]